MSIKIDEPGNEMEALDEEKFSGVLKIISGSGKTKLLFIEEDGENEEKDTLPYDAELLESCECPNTRMEEAMPYSVKEIEKVIEACLVVKKYGTAVLCRLTSID